MAPGPRSRRRLPVKPLEQDRKYRTGRAQNRQLCKTMTAERPSFAAAQLGGYLRCAQVMVNYTALGEASPACGTSVRVRVDRLWCQAAGRVLKPNSAQPKPARYQQHVR